MSPIFLSVLRITKDTKTPTLPRTSRSFVWNWPDVVSNCSQGCLYVMSKIKPSCDYSNSSSDESENTAKVCLIICM
jgi:hypothetical protein